ncbi:TetR family transcriptional regulator [Aureimonas glaciei]|uniref:TetR family transcriptional regulator n=1 Tax=Aureimonas glaciei TaxID=1776957 RepID=A0A917DA73_9HYPH|nr:TetR family transcriptional regulator [Aureimonas glaciei]GGD21229.1 TetR family transcriptional regulator [Aureimonas glaciei]
MRRTKEEALETRSAILDAAEAVFIERGVGRTSLAQIAAAAEVTRGAIYWHFSGKVDLFKAMQDRARLPQETFFHGGEMTRSDRCLDLLYTTTMDAIAGFATDQRAQRVYTIILLRCEYVGEMREALVSRRADDERMKKVLIEVFERAALVGSLGRDWTPALAANAYFCAMVGLFSEWLRLEREFDIVATARPLIDSLFASFRAGCTGTVGLRSQSGCR